MVTLTIKPNGIFVGNKYFGANTIRNRRLLLMDAKTNNWKVYYSYSGRTVNPSKKRVTKKRVGFGMSKNPFGFKPPRF